MWTIILAAIQVMALTAGDSWLEKGANLLLFGPPGAGKSHLAAAIGDTTIELITQRNEMTKSADGHKRTKLHRLIENLITKATTVDDVLDTTGNIIKESTGDLSAIQEIIASVNQLVIAGYGRGARRDRERLATFRGGGNP